MTYLPTWELTQSLNSQIIIVQPSNHNKKNVGTQKGAIITIY